MLQQIVMHTPFWVWALLAFLLYRGAAASCDRELSLAAIAIIPLLMLALSLHGMLASFGMHPLAILSWLGAICAGAAVSWHRVKPEEVRILPATAMVFYRGSWAPLILMLAIFALKYGVSVMLVLQAALRSDPSFMLFTSLSFGLFNGLFLGKMLRVFSMFRQQVAINSVKQHA
ncbi:MAG: hypothetical protein HYZ65_13295 [Burkholderiales bacterium]|nr:hypothetical protein [Burkholderiales bacterium]